MGVFMVVTHGKSSLDLYSLRLSQYLLNVPVVHTDIYQELSRFFNRFLTSSTARFALKAFNFVRKLKATPGIPHLPNHHLGRFARFLKKPFLITVHDLIRYLDTVSYFGSPLIRKPGRWDALWFTMDFKAAGRALKIIVPSNQTKKDLMKFLGVPSWKIKVIHHGVDGVFKPTLSNRPCPEPYILYVGSEHPRKNLKTLLKSFSLLKKDPKCQRLKLVKVGRTGGREYNFREETVKMVKALKIEDDVVFIGWCSQTELASYYSQAEVFAFPSIYEGFGWPPLEAMACGCPVIASNASSTPEILGDAALLVNPYDVEGWREAFDRVLSSDRLRSRLSTWGMARARCFTWEKTAKQTLKVYMEIESSL
jgi:glycosyltransferase involved in cell wall biosynthesis